jgi:DNA-binding transcriptional regulator YiaG
VTKKELIDAVARDSGLTSTDARKAVDSLLTALESGRYVAKRTKTAPAPAAATPFNDEVARIHRAGRLSDRLIAQAVGAAPSTVRDWLACRSAPTGARADKVVALAEIVDRLTRVMDAGYIAVWMTKPIEALDDHRPLDLVAKGQARRVAQLVSSLEDPVAA